MKSTLTKYNYTVRCNDFDCNDKLNIVSILDYFQTVGGRQASELNVGYDEFKKQNLAWILVGVKFNILNDIYHDEDITIHTWPYNPNKLDHMRSFLIYRGDVLCVEGLSRWVLVDYTTHKITRTDISYSNNDIKMLDLEMDNDFFRSNNYHEDLDYVYTFKVTLSDLDHYNHMNNSKYGIIIYNVLKGKNFKDLEIRYINQSILDDEISIYCEEKEEIMFIVGYNKKTDKTIFKAKVHF